MLTIIEKISRVIAFFKRSNFRASVSIRLKTVLKIVKSHYIEVSAAVIVAIIAIQVATPTSLAGLADLDDSSIEAEKEWVSLLVKKMQNETKTAGELPQADLVKMKRTVQIPITAYSSEIWQTAGDPFITAAGTHVRDGVVAANFLPIGTRVRIPELYGDKVFIVEDRMNERYNYKMDIWMDNTPDAKQFGLQFANVEIYPSAPVKRKYSGRMGDRTIVTR